MPRLRAIPAYTLHRPSGQARVRLDGVDHYLGKYGSPESHRRYAELLHRWHARQSESPAIVTIGQLAKLYHGYATHRYVKSGSHTAEPRIVEAALRYVTADFHGLPIDEFSPRKFKLARQRMVEAGMARTGINCYCQRVKRMVRWAVSEELCPPSVYDAIRSVESLHNGCSEARETSPIRPVPIASVRAVARLVSRPVWGMIRVQWRTAMRPGEVRAMRGSDIDRSGNVWVYTPRGHKTQHHGIERVILIGPKAQRILREFWHEGFIFSADRDGGRPYWGVSYRNAILRACVKAGIPPWTPHRLRHTAATRIRAEFGLEVAQAVLGHSDPRMTVRYAQADLRRAITAIGEIG